MYRPKRKIVARIGDVSPEDYGGGALVRVGRDLVLEYTRGAEVELEDGRNAWLGDAEERRRTMPLYRVHVPTLRGGRVDTEGVRSDLDWCRWDSIATSLSMSPWAILAIALDERGAWALYEIAASYHGWDELDSHPIELTYWKIERRWTSRRPRARKAA